MAHTLAIVGKGGTGKTLVTALLTMEIAARKNTRILAIDADSAVSLPYALGIKVMKTLSDLREEIIQDAGTRAGLMDTHMRTVIQELIVPAPLCDVLVMGRPEGPGCYCAINNVLRYGIEALSEQYDIVLVDGEAGPEQINRRVFSSVQRLLVVVDMSSRSIRTAADIAIHGSSGDTRGLLPPGLIVNRARGSGHDVSALADQVGIPLLGIVPDDETVRSFDIRGKPLTELPPDNPCVKAMQRISASLELARGEE